MPVHKPSKWANACVMGPSMLRFPEPPTDYAKLIKRAARRQRSEELLKPLAEVYGGGGPLTAPKSVR